MITRIDHIALAVRNYKKAKKFFIDILGALPGTYAEDSNMKYLWQNLWLGDLSRLELLTPTGEYGLLGKFLEKREGGVHHLTLQTPDISKAKKILEKNGIPYFGFNDYGTLWKELFIHPKDAFGVLIQIAEFNPSDWISDRMKFKEKKKWALEKTAEGCNIIFAHPGGGKVKFNFFKDEVKELLNELSKIAD